MAHTAHVPAETVRKWQEIVDLLAQIMQVPAALVMRVEPPQIKVFVASQSKGNPYEPAEAASLNTGLYCETVMKTRAPLLVPDALIDADWDSNPDIKLGMISYLGVPISWPDGEIFGTICVLDSKPNDYSETFLRLLCQWRDVLQSDLHTLSTLSRKLEENEKKIRRLVDADIIGIFIWDVGGRIVEANEAFLRLLGYDREAFFAHPMRWSDITPPDWLDRDVECWFPELIRNGRLAPIEKEYFRRDGTRVPVLLGAATFEDGGDQGVAFVLDLSERKNAEAEAKESERRYREIETALAHANRVSTLGHLAASISHEIQQPIAACATNAAAGIRWLSAQTPNIDEARKAFERVTQDAKRAGEVMTRIRMLVKNTPADKEWVQINDAIREVIALSRGEAIKARVSVHMHLVDELPLVQCDRVQVQQVILNLVINALEAMSASQSATRELAISTRPAGENAIVISVRDSGPGIAGESVGRLFEPFYTTKTHGMGMGLSICRSIVQALGGTLELSRDVREGAAFDVTFPAA